MLQGWNCNVSIELELSSIRFVWWLRCLVFVSFSLAGRVCDSESSGIHVNGCASVNDTQLAFEVRRVAGTWETRLGHRLSSEKHNKTVQLRKSEVWHPFLESWTATMRLKVTNCSPLYYSAHRTTPTNTYRFPSTMTLLYVSRKLQERSVIISAS